jgi:hypothetical protein
MGSVSSNAPIQAGTTPSVSLKRSSMPVIPATWEAEIGGWQFEVSWEKVGEVLSQKTSPVC